MICQRCHRPLKHAAEYGPVCRKKVQPATGERDLFKSIISTDCEGALFRVELSIAVMAAAARGAVRDAFAAARERLRQRYCAHAMYLDDLGRREGEIVRCPCAKCGKVLEASCGISLPGKWLGWRKDAHG